MTELAFRPRSGAISRAPREQKPNPYFDAVKQLVPGSGEGLEVDITYADALEQFPDLPDGKDKDGKPKRRPATREEAMSKLLAWTRRKLTEAGDATDPPVTVHWDGGIEQADGETVTIYFKAGEKIVRKSGDQ